MMLRWSQQWFREGRPIAVQRTLYALVVLNMAAFIAMTMCIVLDSFKVYIPRHSVRDCDINTRAAVESTNAHDKEAHKPLTAPSWTEIEANFTTIQNGGRWRPKRNQPGHSIAVIVPYRDREVHLKLFLAHMHPFLQRQNLEYVIYVAEMEAEGLFKKTRIMNAAFLEVTRRENTSCIIFHDVDMLPLDDNNLYYCRPGVVRHLATAVQQFNYTLPYWGYIGGVLAFPPSLYRQVNGLSNLYSGWGGEDDDLYLRIRAVDIFIERPRLLIGRYKSWQHKRQPVLENRMGYVMEAVERMKEDGLNTVNYHLDRVVEKPLYTWLLIRTNNTINIYHNDTTKITN